MQILRKLMLSVALLCVPPLAQASLIFSFSFDNTLGSVPGPIKGKILGLQDNSELPATAVILTDVGSHPFGHGLPYDVIAQGWQVFLDSNSFKVANGAITAWIFHASHAHGVNEELDITSNGPGGGPFSLFAVGLPGQSGFTVAQGIQFLRQGEVPTPSTLFLLGLGALIVFRSRRAAPT